MSESQNIEYKNKGNERDLVELVGKYKRRKPIEEIANMVNTVARDIINYYHKFQQNDIRAV